MPFPTRILYPRPFFAVSFHGYYSLLERGLRADELTCYALGGRSSLIPTMLIAASTQQIVDFTPVPADTVEAHWHHLLAHQPPEGIKLGIPGDVRALEPLFRYHAEHPVPLILDITLSGPGGEKLAGYDTQAWLKAHLPFADLVLIRRRDAEHLLNMPIPSLDDAQVAAQRLAQWGAQKLVLKCGRIPYRFFETSQALPPWSMDLYFDGVEFSLLEAPFIEVAHLHGASSAFSCFILRELIDKQPVISSLQHAKIYVTEAIRRHRRVKGLPQLNYTWIYEENLQQSTQG